MAMEECNVSGDAQSDAFYPTPYLAPIANPVFENEIEC
jgi:hypothetical protein